MSELCSICLEKSILWHTECNHKYCINCLCRIKKCAMCRNPLQRAKICEQINKNNIFFEDDVLNAFYMFGIINRNHRLLFS